jgi:antitoxin MazE
MNLRVRKWGNSLAIRLPKDVARPLQLEEGTTLQLEVVDGNLLFTPERGKRTLDQLLAGVTPETIHSETDWGDPRAAEIW